MTLALSACSSLVPTRPVNYTIDDLLRRERFYIAHRGSGDNWTEHTMDAYSRSAALGAMAIEVSVHSTSDGVLVCHHDDNTLRMTGHDLTIADTTWRTLSELRNDARRWLGPASGLHPIPRLDDVLRRFAASHVLFLESKQGDPLPLLTAMKKQKTAVRHLVWKQFAHVPVPEAVTAAGFRTWGYFNAGDEALFAENAPHFDYLGVNRQSSDAEAAALVAYGKPVIGWEIHNRSERDRLARLGVRGVMCSNLPYVTSAKPQHTTDRFGSGLRAAGDLPWIVEAPTPIQPTLMPSVSAARLDARGGSSYLMGSMCPTPRDGYTIRFELRWPHGISADIESAGIVLGSADDSSALLSALPTSGGYSVLCNSHGTVTLYRRDPGAMPHKLARFATKRPSRGQWLQFEITVTPTTLRARRIGRAGWSASVEDSTYRGGYFSLNTQGRSPVVDFRAVSVAR